MTSLQVAISFDTTGSMSRALGEVRKRISEIVHYLKQDIPGVTMSIIAHGDYCDKDIYVTKHLDFTDDEPSLLTFVRDVKETGGGDAPECYELVLREVRTKLSWRKRSQKILLVIGDSYPHPPDYPQNVDRIDWEQEARLLAGMSMRIYGAQINNDRKSEDFFRKLTQMSGGSHFQLTDFEVLSDVIMAVCYRATGVDTLKGLEKKVRARYAPRPLHKELEEVFTVLHEPLPVPTVPAQKTKTSPYVYQGKDVAFVWGGKMTPSQTLGWTAPEEDDTVHKLQVKLAVLGPEARAHEANIVEAETRGFEGETLSLPIVHMLGGKDSMAVVDLSFNCSVTFRMVSGSGPVYLSGQHVARSLPEDEEEQQESRVGRATGITVQEGPLQDFEAPVYQDCFSAHTLKEEVLEINDDESDHTSERNEGDTGNDSSDDYTSERIEGGTGKDGSDDHTSETFDDASASVDPTVIFERGLRSSMAPVSQLYGIRHEESKPPGCKTS